jgi:tetratricopeptide (TPR) repeat protein
MAERALSLHESCLPTDSPAIATDLATLARIRHLLGDHEAAVPLAERALRIDEAAYGPDDPYVSFDLIALASVHLDLGDPALAVPLIARALRIREASYASDHLYIGYALLLKAQAVHALNDPTAAELARRGALILETRLGKTHPKTRDAFALVDLLKRDSCCHAQGEVVAAGNLAIHVHRALP